MTACRDPAGRGQPCTANQGYLSNVTEDRNNINGIARPTLSGGGLLTATSGDFDFLALPPALLVREGLGCREAFGIGSSEISEHEQGGNRWMVMGNAL